MKMDRNQIDEETFQDDIRRYEKKNCLSFIQKPDFHIYILLAVSLLLIITFYIVVLSKASTLSSEISKSNVQFTEALIKSDQQLFPCGPNNRQWEYFNGKCYYFSLEKATWRTAENQCQDRRAQLVVINDVAEQYFLQTRARNERHWIGLKERDAEGNWKWVDDSNYRSGFMYWKQGEPYNDLDNEDCAHLWRNGEWNSVYCIYLCYYICEKSLPSIF